MRNIIACIIISIFCFFHCGKFKESDEYNISDKNSSIPVLSYYGDSFINSDYIFPDNESLNKPIGIKKNPITSEFIVLDIGNNCLYVFSPKGKYIKKIGTPGQGPGDLLRPEYFTFDSQGDLYVYEEGNSRISIFSKNGKFIESFRIRRHEETRFCVSKNMEIIMNLPARGYYITVFSRNGEVCKEIGKIDRINKDDYINISMAKGIPFQNNTGKYYIFLEGTLAIKVYNENGDFMNEYQFDKVIGYTDLRKYYTPPEKQKSFVNYVSVLDYIIDIVMNNNNFFITTYIEDGEPILELDSNLNLINKYKIDKIIHTTIPTTWNIEHYRHLIFFEVVKSNKEIEFYIPSVDDSEIYKFSIRN